MAKRFTSTEKWDKEWFQMLTSSEVPLAVHHGPQRPRRRLGSELSAGEFLHREEVTEGDLAAFGERLKSSETTRFGLRALWISVMKTSPTSKPHASVIASKFFENTKG